MLDAHAGRRHEHAAAHLAHVLLVFAVHLRGQCSQDWRGEEGRGFSQALGQGRRGSPWQDQGQPGLLKSPAHMGRFTGGSKHLRSKKRPPGATVSSPTASQSLLLARQDPGGPDPGHSSTSPQHPHFVSRLPLPAQAPEAELTEQLLGAGLATQVGVKQRKTLLAKAWHPGSFLQIFLLSFFALF